MGSKIPPDFAFPKSQVQGQGGLTKAEYFAGCALQGILANPSLTVSLGQTEKIVKSARMIGEALFEEFANQEPA